MIYVYGLAYWILEYPDRTIKRLLETASEKVHITVVEGKSKNSPSFLEWGKKLLEEDKIQKFIAADMNCRMQGCQWAYDQFPPDDSEDFCIFTDLDVLVPQGVDWIQEVRKNIKNSVICGFSMDLCNYVPPNGGHCEDGFGPWLMAVKKEPYLLYPKHLVFQDMPMRSHMSKFGNEIQSPIRLYHLTWDSWFWHPDYWEQKMSGEGQNPQSSAGAKINYEVFTK